MYEFICSICALPKWKLDLVTQVTCYFSWAFEIGAWANPLGSRLQDTTGFLFLSTFVLSPQVAPCSSLQSAASSCFLATVSLQWLAGNACSAGPASQPGMLWMWSQWSCIPPTRGQFFPGVSSRTCLNCFAQKPTSCWILDHTWSCPSWSPCSKCLLGILLSLQDDDSSLGLGRVGFDRIEWVKRTRG